MKILRIQLFCIIFLIPFLSWSQPNWQKISTVEEVCSAYPEQMKSIFQDLNLGYEGLKEVRMAYKNEDIERACELLLSHYQTKSETQARKKELPEISRSTRAKADSIVRDIFTFQRVSGKVPRLDEGHLKWSHKGPEDDMEWAWMLNRHIPIKELLPVYFETGNPDYARYINSFIKDWIISSWPYPGERSSTAMWRGLEVRSRVQVWARVFYELMDSNFISPATRLLILSSLPDHAHYLRNFHGQGNWLTMEMNGLATVATAWPEFEKSDEWLEYTIASMTESMKEQVYPDGVQTELTSHYHRVALSNFESFHEICSRAQKSLPGYFTEQIENMWNYLACTMRPDGYGLLNNDSDLDYNRENVFDVALKYGREDWKFIASNGQKGVQPEEGPSFIFPWAGHLISRSGYDKHAHWSFFDMGPWGTGHQHNDKLHFSASAYGHDLLVDAGRFAYRGEVANKFRGYARGSQGHNVILVDEKGQDPGPERAEAPLSEKNYKITDEYDFAYSSFDRFNDLEGTCKHTRALFYVRDNFWIVADRISTDRPRKIEALWHWHPECEVTKSTGNTVSTRNENGNLEIIPLGKTKWKVDLIKGQEKPVIQGWYSEEYNRYEPNMVSVYSTQVETDATFAWILFPSQEIASDVQAEIVSQNTDELVIRVTSDGKKQWKVTVPFTDSDKANLRFNSEISN